jgi:hypothetical protein
VIDAPRDIASTRAKIKAEAASKGTWGTHPVGGDRKLANQVEGASLLD